MANEEHLNILNQGVEAWNQWRKENPDPWPNLTGANLFWADISANESHKGGHAHSGFEFFYASLIRANLQGAILIEAHLSLSNLTKAILTRANLTEAKARYTIFGDIDLSPVQGLDTVRHEGPSTIGINTISRSKGNIPEIFLRGCGLSDWEIEATKLYQPHLTSAEFTDITYKIHELRLIAIQYHSSFISYSSKDEDFTQRLHADLQDKGVRCWFAPEDLKIGAKIRPSIDESIRVYDKLLLVLSERSVTSQWVEQEVETALAREREQEQIVLFPIRLDNAVMKMEGAGQR